MVADANIKRIQAEKRLAESDMKVSPYHIISLVADKMPTKIKFYFSKFYLCLLPTFWRYGTFISVFIDRKSKGSNKKVDIKVFPTFC